MAGKTGHAVNRDGIEEIDRLTGSNYMKMIDECTHLSEKQEMLVEQMCTDIADVIESEGVFYE